MKTNNLKIIFGLILILLLFCAIAVQPLLGQNEELRWEKQTIDENFNQETSIAIDSNDNPHISYTDNSVRYTRWNGNTWITEKVDPNGNVLDVSLALDSKDNPHIVYHNSSSDITGVKYARWDGTQWNIELVDGSEKGSVGSDLSIAIDNNDNPHIAYYSLSDNGSLKYAVFNEGTWSIEIIDGEKNTKFCCHLGWDPSIAIDNNDNPHISYYNFTGLSLKYAKLEQNKWNIQTVDNKPDDASNGSVGEYSSIAIDNNGNPHISYHRFSENPSENNLKYAFFNGQDWNTEIVDKKGDLGTYTSIDIDSKDQPHISYYNESGTTSLKYTIFNNSQNQWNTKTVLQKNFKGRNCCLSRGTYSSLALDNNDNPHISYENRTLASLEYVHKVSRENRDQESIIDQYDTNNNNQIDRDELRNSIIDFVRKDITRNQLRKLIISFVQGQI